MSVLSILVPFEFCQTCGHWLAVCHVFSKERQLLLRPPMQAGLGLMCVLCHPCHPLAWPAFFSSTADSFVGRSSFIATCWKRMRCRFSTLCLWALCCPCQWDGCADGGVPYFACFSSWAPGIAIIRLFVAVCFYLEISGWGFRETSDWIWSPACPSELEKWTNSHAHAEEHSRRWAIACFAFCCWVCKARGGCRHGKRERGSEDVGSTCACSIQDATTYQGCWMGGSRWRRRVRSSRKRSHRSCTDSQHTTVSTTATLTVFVRSSNTSSFDFSVAENCGVGQLWRWSVVSRYAAAWAFVFWSDHRAFKDCDPVSRFASLSCKSGASRQSWTLRTKFIIWIAFSPNKWWNLARITGLHGVSQTWGESLHHFVTTSSSSSWNTYPGFHWKSGCVVTKESCRAALLGLKWDHIGMGRSSCLRMIPHHSSCSAFA